MLEKLFCAAKKRKGTQSETRSRAAYTVGNNKLGTATETPTLLRSDSYKDGLDDGLLVS